MKNGTDYCKYITFIFKSEFFTLVMESERGEILQIKSVYRILVCVCVRVFVCLNAVSASLHESDKWGSSWL